MSRKNPVMVVHNDPGSGEMLLRPQEEQPNIESALRTAAIPKLTIAEITARLPPPLARFLLERVPSGQGHLVDQDTAAEIIHRRTDMIMAMESAFLCAQYALDQSAPHPDDPNWDTIMKDRQILEEYARSRFQRILTLPFLRR